MDFNGRKRRNLIIFIRFWLWMGRGEGRRGDMCPLFVHPPPHLFSTFLPVAKEGRPSVAFSFSFFSQTKKLNEAMKPQRECAPCRTSLGLVERFIETKRSVPALLTLTLRVGVVMSSPSLQKLRLCSARRPKTEEN